MIPCKRLPASCPVLAIALSLCAIGAGAAQSDGAAVQTLDPVIEQLLNVQDVGAPVLSPDGRRAAYLVSRYDASHDKMVSDIWLVNLETGEQRQLTHTKEGEWGVAWHPQANALTFLSDRHDPDEAEGQLWVLPLAGGEARRITDIEGGIEDYQYAPDGAWIAAVVPDPDPFEPPDESQDITTAPPIVIDRFYFKEDGVGYRTRGRRIYLLDASSGKGKALALPGVEPSSPAFSPDGRRLAFVAKGGREPDRVDNFDLYLMSLQGPPKAYALAPSSMNDCGQVLQDRPRWSPDGGAIACLSAATDRDNLYAMSVLKVFDTRSGSHLILTRSLDRNVYYPRFSPDGEQILFTVEDDMQVQLASVPRDGGEVRKLAAGEMHVDDFAVGPGGRVIARVGHIDRPWEIHTLEDGAFRAVTGHNDALLAERPWRRAQKISFNSADGTEVHGLLMKPKAWKKNRPLPTVLWIHGGPTSQFAWEPRLDPQLFAGHGYAVLLINPRGSTGRGEAYARGIYGAWGSVDVPDVLAGVDYAVEKGIADPDRLYIGGWSYGGMLTNYVIASDKRFRAAASGAAISNAWAGFGTDMYIRDYLSELGAPWEDPEAWNRVSYPFMQANRIVTPTLFMVGERDYNVPLLATEQMYQALKVLRVPTRMVIYPGESHSIGVPSYRADIWQRYLDWFAEYR